VSTLINNKDPTIICLQEHWLLNYEASSIETTFPTQSAQVKCIDDSNPIPPSHRPRGYGGTATLWNKELDHCIERLADGSSRVNAILINSRPKPTILINTYMPTEGTHTEDTYEEILDEIHTLKEKYKEHSLIWAGDINADPKRAKSSNDKKLHLFISEENLKIFPILDDQPTFYHFNGKSTSSIDKFISDSSPAHPTTVDQRNPLNSSSHDAVS